MKVFSRKKGQKGFTLVEVIVVLIIIAILAAIGIPAMTGYIDNARKRTAITEARNALIAVQLMATDEYSKLTGSATLTKIIEASADAIYLELNGSATGEFEGDVTVDTAGTVTDFTFNASGAYTVKYAKTGSAAGTFTTEKD